MVAVGLRPVGWCVSAVKEGVVNDEQQEAGQTMAIIIVGIWTVLCVAGAIKYVFWPRITELSWSWDTAADNYGELSPLIAMATIGWAISSWWLAGMMLGGVRNVDTPGPVMRDMSRGDYDPPWGDAPSR
jgi:hypothetical protein